MSDDLAYLQGQNQNEQLAVPLLRLAGAVQAALAWQQKVCLLTLSWLSLCITHPDNDSTIRYDVESESHRDVCSVCWFLPAASEVERPVLPEALKPASQANSPWSVVISVYALFALR